MFTLYLCKKLFYNMQKAAAGKTAAAQKTICNYPSYPFGFWLCHLQESSHISSSPLSASQ